VEDPRRRYLSEWGAVRLASAACAAAGWLAFVVSHEVARATGLTTRTSVLAGMYLITLPGIFVIGLAAGAAVPRGWFLFGPCIVVFLPCKAAVEILLDPTSHNLWPFEMVFYVAFAMLGAAGAGLGALARWIVTRRRTAEPSAPDPGGGGPSRP
jgi:hypothetical protein